MLRAIITVAMTLSVASTSGSAYAMKMSSSEPARCRVVGGDKLPAGAGGEQAVCSAIERAVAAEAPGNSASIEVRVISAYSLAATIRTADGRTLPEQRMATMDRTLTKSSIQRFAQAIAAELAATSRH